MAKASGLELQVGARAVRVSSPDRVVYEATDWAPAVTKLQVCEYFAAVGEVMMHAIGATARWRLERWPGGWREGMTLSVDAVGHQTGDGFYSKRLPKGAPDWIQTCQVTTPSGRRIDELCLTEPAAAVWAAQMGTLTFHPWAVRGADVEHPDEVRIDLDPQPGATFADAQAGRGRRRASCSRSSGLRGFPKTSGNRGIHVYVRIRPEWTFDDVRHAAIGFGRELERRDDGRDHGLVEGGTRGAHLRRLQPEPPGPDHRAGAWSAAAASGCAGVAHR